MTIGVRRVEGVAGTELAFGDFVDKVVREAQPLGQNASPGDLGFGWIYYGFVRNLRPDFVVAIGSCRGFMPFCAARALRDNGAGRLVFVDPSYSGVGDPGWDGEGAWGDAAAVAEWIADFGLADWMTHVKATSAEAFPQVAELVRGGTVGIVIIDGAHTFENSLQDFELYSSLVGDGFVLFHDSTNPSCAVSSTVRALAAQGYPLLTIDRDAGLTIVSVSGGGSVEAHWAYLSAPSNRAARILPYARSILRPGDRVLDVYCGCAPLASLLDDVEIFGCDRDPAIVRTLRAELPQHRWAQPWLRSPRRRRCSAPPGEVAVGAPLPAEPERRRPS